MRTLLLLLVVVCVGVYAAGDSVTLPLVDGEFVWLHVGYPGMDVAFWVRWDLDYSVLSMQVDIRAASRSWSAASMTDVVCFGAICKRMQFATVDYIAYPEIPANLLPTPVRGYNGLLGLGRRSPVWSIFPYYRLSARSLVLMRRALPPLAHATHYPGGVVPMRVSGTPVLATIDLGTDYTSFPWPVAGGAASEADRWRVDIYSPNGTRRATRVSLPVWYYRYEAQHLHAIRPSDNLPTIADVVAESSTAPRWNHTAVLGRTLVQSGFVVQQSGMGVGGAWVACDWTTVPLVTQIDYLTWFLVLLPLTMLWLCAIADSVDYAARVDALQAPLPPAANRLRLQNGVDFVIAQPARFELPAPLNHGVEPVALLSFRHTGFATALTLVTQFTFTAAMLTVVLGFGWTSQFWASTFSTQDSVAVYSSAGVAAALCPTLWMLDAWPMTTAAFGDAVVLLAIWMMASVFPFGSANSMVMLLTSAGVAIYAVQLFVQLVLKRLWPWNAYRSRAWALWALPLLAFAIWAVWLFAFYSVVLVTLAWRQEHPGVWALASFAAVLVVFVVHRNLAVQARVRLVMRTAGRELMDLASAGLSKDIASMRNHSWSTNPAPPAIPTL